MLDTKKIVISHYYESDKITERDKQDFWIQKHQDEVDKLMKKETSMLNRR